MCSVERPEWKWDQTRYLRVVDILHHRHKISFHGLLVESECLPSKKVVDPWCLLRLRRSPWVPSSVRSLTHGPLRDTVLQSERIFLPLDGGNPPLASLPAY